MESNIYDTLRGEIKKLFDGATDKTQIESSIHLNDLVDSAEKEQKQLIDSKAELIADYKKVIQGTSFKEKPDDVIPETPKVKSLEEIAKKLLNK